jgi:hypothetical protein
LLHSITKESDQKKRKIVLSVNNLLSSFATHCCRQLFVGGRVESSNVKRSFSVKIIFSLTHSRTQGGGGEVEGN